MNDATKKIPVPPFWGTKVISVPVDKLFKFVDEGVLFKARWRFNRGSLDENAYKKILDEKARPLLENWRNRIIRENLVTPKAVYGYFPCNSFGDELHVYKEPNMGCIFVKFNFPRQKTDPRKLCLADYFLARSNLKNEDVVAMQLVTVGEAAGQFSSQLYNDSQYSDYFYFHGLCSDLAEAAAEYIHAEIREELKIGPKDGARYSFGYPACPSLEDNRTLLGCLSSEKIGVSVNESLQMVPEQSTAAIVAWNPRATYFSI